MKLLIWIILTVGILTFNLTDVLAHNNDDTKELNQRVSQIVDLLKDSYASEYPKARHIRIHNLSGDSKLAVVIFTIESFCLGNNWNQFMAVFYTLCETSEGHPQRFSLLDVMGVGGKGWRAVEGDKIDIAYDNRSNIATITLKTKEYGSEDAMCCPSIESKVIFKINLNRGERLKK